MPYKHPLIVSWLKVFGWKVSGTGKIFADNFPGRMKSRLGVSK